MSWTYMQSFSFISLTISEKKIFEYFFESLPFMLPWQPIKFSDFDKIHMNRWGLLKKHICKKNLNICSETAKIANFHFSHYKLMETICCHNGIQKLWFLHAACRWMLVNISMKFHEDTLKWFQSYRADMICHRNAHYKLQRDVTKKIHIQELWFLHSACHLLMLYICMEFYECILDSFKVIERTRLCQEAGT